MLPLLVAFLGLLVLAAGWGLVQRLGPRVRIGRILASTPVVPVATAIGLADRPRYIGVRGRVDADEEFEDADHRPLVYRRTRFEAERRPGRWVAFEDERQAVPFRINEGLDSIGVDESALDDGVVVIARESIGTAADIPGRAPADLAPGTPVRLRIEQVSSVEHALVLGVPARNPDGSVTLRAGFGRPLVLTTLEPREALRLVGGGRRRQAVVASLALAAGGALVVLGLAWLLLDVLGGLVAPAAALAATPSASPAVGGDPRSPGEGPGLVGDPLFAIGGVLAIALGTTIGVLAYVRATGGARPAAGAEVDPRRRG